MKKPRITFLIQNLGPGGAQRHTVGLLAGLIDEFNFSVVLQEPVFDDGITGLNPAFDISLPSQEECNARHIKRWLATCQRIKQTNPDIVICINQVALLVAMLGRINGIFKAPISTIFHSTEIGNLAGWIRTIPFILAARFSDGIFYISKNQQKIWGSRGLSAKHTWTIRNGLDLNRVKPVSSEVRQSTRISLGFDSSDIVIGCLAVLRYEKNHLQQVEAVRILRNSGFPAKLLLVGDGPKRNEIEEAIKKADLFDHVVLAGMQKDVSKFISAMDIGWITSLSIETLSLAALECMALGVPMIMSDIGGASEIIEPGFNGFLFPPGDTSNLVKFVKELEPRDVRERFGRAAQNTVNQNFSSAQMLSDYADAFRKIVSIRG